VINRPCWEVLQGTDRTHRHPIPMTAREPRTSGWEFLLGGRFWTSETGTRAAGPSRWPDPAGLDPEPPRAVWKSSMGPWSAVLRTRGLDGGEHADRGTPRRHPPVGYLHFRSGW